MVYENGQNEVSHTKRYTPCLISKQIRSLLVVVLFHYFPRKDELGDFRAHKSAGKFSNVLRSNNDCEKGVSMTEKIDTKSELDVLKGKHSPASRCDDRYIVEKPANVTHHRDFSQNPGRRVVRRAAMKTHGSHGPSAADTNELRR